MFDPVDTTRARLEMNAKHYEPDPLLDKALALFESDRAAWDKLPADIRSQAGIHVDFRASYRAAVKAGAIQADRGPA